MTMQNSRGQTATTPSNNFDRLLDGIVNHLKRCPDGVFKGTRRQLIRAVVNVTPSLAGANFDNLLRGFSQALHMKGEERGIVDSLVATQPGCEQIYFFGLVTKVAR
jgi:hypothetical protein